MLNHRMRCTKWMSHSVQYFVRKCGIYFYCNWNCDNEQWQKKMLTLYIVFFLMKIRWSHWLTYLTYLYQFLIRWSKSIGSNALVMTKILITPEWHLCFVFRSCDIVYFTSFRFVPRECWCRNTIRKTLQSHCLANPRLLRWRGDISNCGRV